MKNYAQGGNDCAAWILNDLGIKRVKTLSKSQVFSGGVIKFIMDNLKSWEKLRVQAFVLEKSELKKGDICFFSLRRGRIPHHLAIFLDQNTVKHCVPGSPVGEGWIDFSNFIFAVRVIKWD